MSFKTDRKYNFELNCPFSVTFGSFSWWSSELCQQQKIQTGVKQENWRTPNLEQCYFRGCWLQQKRQIENYLILCKKYIVINITWFYKIYQHEHYINYWEAIFSNILNSFWANNEIWKCWFTHLLKRKIYKWSRIPHLWFLVL